MRKNSIILISALFLFFGVVFSKAEAVSQYDSYVSFSSEKLYQGDTFLIKIKKEAGISNASAKFLSQKSAFFKSSAGDLIAFFGVDAKKVPGAYSFIIYFPDGSQYIKKIKVIKKDFQITKLLFNENLEDKGYTAKSVSKTTGNNASSFFTVLSFNSVSAFFAKPFIYPILEIKDVGNYGNIRKSKNVSLQHLGVDLDAEENTPVYAINDGVVVFAGYLENYGNTIVISHGAGIFSLYLHLKEFKVSIPQIVKRGDAVGLSGNTGYSLEPHLHLSIHINGASIDPLLFIETSVAEMPE